MKRFFYERKIHYYETDAMGVVHHANHLRIIEEARVAWLNNRGLKGFHYPEVDWHMAVTSSSVQYLKPMLFDQLIRIELQVKREGIRLFIRYALFKGDELLSTAETVHVPLNESLKPVKIPQQLKEGLEKEPWIETWPSSLSESLKKQP